MSIQGDVFQKIIDEIVQASQADFEENGVNQQTLVELQQVSWYLSSLLFATFTSAILFRSLLQKRFALRNIVERKRWIDSWLATTCSAQNRQQRRWK